MSSIERRSRLAIRIDAARRLLLWHVFSGKTPYYLVSEFPKCGGSWVAQMLAAYISIPFPRNKNVSVVRRRPSVLHGHRMYHKHFKNAVYVLRDGRDALVSAYYHNLIPNDRNPHWAVERKRRELSIKNVEDIERNLPAFIEYMFTKYTNSFFHFSWADFAFSLIKSNIHFVRYEDLLIDTPMTFAGVIKRITGKEPNMKRVVEVCDRFSFKNQAKRNRGEQDNSSFLRKGIAGDWKTKFNRETCKVFDKYAGEALIHTGYEKDHEWVMQHKIVKE